MQIGYDRQKGPADYTYILQDALIKIEMNSKGDNGSPISSAAPNKGDAKRVDSPSRRDEDTYSSSGREREREQKRTDRDTGTNDRYRRKRCGNDDYSRDDGRRRDGYSRNDN